MIWYDKNYRIIITVSWWHNEIYNLNVSSDNVGGYFSSEQLELLSIIQCQTYEDVVAFAYQCRKLNGIFSHDDLKKFVYQDLEKLKRFIFKSYQDILTIM